jgi:hypothetical protein
VFPLAGCTLSPPAADPSTQPTAAGAAVDLSPGAHVQVARQGQWYGATILQVLGEGRFLVHYDNIGNEWNEAVGPDRIKAYQPARDYHPGDRVLVTYQNRLLVGEIVLQVAADSFRVHYDGFGPEAVESVTVDRIRRPFSGNSAHAVGDSLTVDVNGQPLPAKVIAVSTADHWVVRFDTYGPQYDQEIGVDRIKVGAAPPSAPTTPPPSQPVPAIVPEKPAIVAEKPGEKPKAKPAPAIEGAPAPQAGPPAVGESVLIHLHGAWLAATVLELGPAIKVKFAGGGEGAEGLDRVLREPASLKGLHYQPGQLVLVEYKGIYVPAKVLKQDGKDYKVRFDGFGPEGDEVVIGKRLRPR